MSKIRVMFNRELTFAEVETFRTEIADILAMEPGHIIKWHATESRQRIYIESPFFDSRTLYNEVADWAANAVVNLHPVAVRTFSDDVVEFDYEEALEAPYVSVVVDDSPPEKMTIGEWFKSLATSSAP